jgi:hypothetical protein
MGNMGFGGDMCRVFVTPGDRVDDLGDLADALQPALRLDDRLTAKR